MATVIHLGVVDLPYVEGGMTTGRLARILEDKYGVMNAFTRRRKTAIQAAIVDSLEGAVESLAMGRNDVRPYAQACSAIAGEFKDFLEKSEIEQMDIAGVPTLAAIMGVSHRFKGKKNKGKGRKGVGVRRPSFIDTGTYSASAIAWVD